MLLTCEHLGLEEDSCNDSLAMHMLMQQWQVNLCISVSLIPRPSPSFLLFVLQVTGSWARA